MTQRLTALDATFLELEELDDGAVMNIGGVMMFDPLPDGGAPTLEELCSKASDRLGGLAPYSQRLSCTRTGSWSWPHWCDDDRFDIRNHVRHAALPAPGTAAQLCDWSAEFFSHPLDRRLPLWELVLLEGLQSGGWALGWKTHRCLVDGVGSVGVIDLLLDREPTEPRSGRRDVPARGPAAPLRPGWQPSEVVMQAAEAGARAAVAGSHALLHPREALRRSVALAELIVRDELVRAPHTSLNSSIGQARRFAVVRAPLAELKAIEQTLGGSVNDVVLAACTSGLRDLLVARDEPLPSGGLRAMVPVNLRDGTGQFARGGRVSSLFVPLPVAEADPRARWREIAAATKRCKRPGGADGVTALIDLATLVPPVVVEAALARTVLAARLFNLTITNVPGPEHPLYAFGSLMREVYPVVPLAAGHAVGIAVFSYNGLIAFGISADGESTPDLDVLAYGIEAGLEDLRALVPEIEQTPLEARF
jgi:diacylglycerol O-acyltransferase